MAVYVAEPMQFSATAVIHFPRLKDRLATHFVPFSQSGPMLRTGNLPTFHSYPADHEDGDALHDSASSRERAAPWVVSGSTGDAISVRW
jgi:hypothetical protein